MARVTVEDCLGNTANRFELVLLAAKRARQLARGATPLLPEENDKPTVLALREIAAGKVDTSLLDESPDTDYFEESDFSLNTLPLTETEGDEVTDGEAEAVAHGSEEEEQGDVPGEEDSLPVEMLPVDMAPDAGPPLEAERENESPEGSLEDLGEADLAGEFSEDPPREDDALQPS